ncbi:GlxA family transcriptional regulator [Neptuniibacter caesariensis]|uniref:Probable transcriptional regulator n=1 Tax=Neptuniibacter caesariensis TaxID=207954 RepID=A0A7U8GR36_NEPCE|nr:GlxA family transcriptional regulator [Neptuniibacter caesariensis]EAR60942.1 probable transcriptional regulator [Oceanospirillum sp. MED92] [Neptuniibacter caesariensis]
MKTVAVYAHPDCQILDVTGPLQVFASANTALARDAYEILILGPHKDTPVRTNSGMRLLPDYGYDEAPELDTLLIAGGRGISEQLKNDVLLAWLKAQERNVRRLGSVCSGAFLLAEAGLLKGKKVATHWRCSQLLAKEYDGLEVDDDAIWIKQGHLFTSAGVTSGIDLALALVEEDYGHRIAMEVARELVVFMKRPGGQSQYSIQLQAQEKATGAVAKVVAYIEMNLANDLSLARLCEVGCISERHLFRLFKNIFDLSPAAYVENCRLNLAQQLVVEGQLNLQNIAERSGFYTADNLRRVFVRRLGINPSEYKRRFGSSIQESSL